MPIENYITGNEKIQIKEITEGFHRKMKLIQRRAYGFRNFENYRLRIRVLCA